MSWKKVVEVAVDVALVVIVAASALAEAFAKWASTEDPGAGLDP